MVHRMTNIYVLCLQLSLHTRVQVRRSTCVAYMRHRLATLAACGTDAVVMWSLAAAEPPMASHASQHPALCLLVLRHHTQAADSGAPRFVRPRPTMPDNKPDCTYQSTTRAASRRSRHRTLSHAIPHPLRPSFCNATFIHRLFFNEAAHLVSQRCLKPGTL